MRHREHSDEAIILGSGASTNEAIRDSLRLSRHIELINDMLRINSRPHRCAMANQSDQPPPERS